MILVSFFHNSAQIPVNGKKLIFYLHFRPDLEQITVNPQLEVDLQYRSTLLEVG